MAATKAGADSGRRALEVLFAFTEQRPQLSMRELADELGIPVSTTHRYVSLLRDMGLVDERGRGQYHLTMRVAALGRAARGATPMAVLAEPYMRELVQKTGETAILVRMVHQRPVCIHRVESSQPIRLSFEVGQQLPALRGASARLLLGSFSPAERERYVDQALEDGAVPPAQGRDQFLRDIERDSSRGWAVSRHEIDRGVWSAAAPVSDGTDTPMTLSAPSPAFRIDEAEEETIIELVRKTAADISRALGA